MLGHVWVLNTLSHLTLTGTLQDGFYLPLSDEELEVWLLRAKIRQLVSKELSVGPTSVRHLLFLHLQEKVLQLVEASWGAHLRCCLMKRQLKIKGVFLLWLTQSRNASYQFTKLHLLSAVFKYVTLWIMIYKVIMREQPSEWSNSFTPQYGSHWIITETPPV